MIKENGERLPVCADVSNTSGQPFLRAAFPKDTCLLWASTTEQSPGSRDRSQVRLCSMEALSLCPSLWHSVLCPRQPSKVPVHHTLLNQWRRAVVLAVKATYTKLLPFVLPNATSRVSKAQAVLQESGGLRASEQAAGSSHKRSRLENSPPLKFLESEALN